MANMEEEEEEEAAMVKGRARWKTGTVGMEGSEEKEEEKVSRTLSKPSGILRMRGSTTKVKGRGRVVGKMIMMMRIWCGIGLWCPWEGGGR